MTNKQILESIRALAPVSYTHLRNEDAVPSAEEKLTPQKEEASADDDDA